MFNPTTSLDIANATSSPALADGASPCVSPAGQTTGPSGQEVTPASHGRLPEKGSGSRTIGSSGHTSKSLSPSDALQHSLESSLRRRLSGSELYEVVWKPWTTPWGSCLSRPRARARGTKGIEHGYLPTPSGTSNRGKNHVAGRLDEWGGSSNPFRGTSLGKVHCPAFELWVMGYPEAWGQLMPPAMPSSRKSRPK